MADFSASPDLGLFQQYRSNPVVATDFAPNSSNVLIKALAQNLGSFANANLAGNAVASILQVRGDGTCICQLPATTFRSGRIELRASLPVGLPRN
jgi:hypothetical protein